MLLKKKNLLSYGSQKRGFTLAELMIAVVVFMITFVGILLGYLRCMELSEMAKNSSLAVAAVKSRMEDIKNTDFSNIMNNYNKITFTANGINGRGVSYVEIDNANPKLLKVTVTFCWKQRSGLLIGEDADLDGQLDAGEDKNANNILDSITQAVSYVYDT